MKRTAALVAVVLATGFGPSPGNHVAGAAFDFDNGNAAAELVIPRAIQAILQSVSPGAGDPPVILRITALTTTAWFDAIAPYHPTAVGVYSRPPRRPAGEATDRNRNIAILYGSYRVLTDLLPMHDALWREMLTSVGLDPDDTSQDPASPVGIGNVAGKAVTAARRHDGMNQLGDEGGRNYNRQPYSNYLGYAPVNTAYELRNPSRWQPNVNSPLVGQFSVQQFVMAQWGVTTPFSYRTPASFHVPPPQRSNHHRRQNYVTQADEVLALSAALTDEQKAAAELFDNKFASLFASAAFVAQTRGLGLEDFVILDFATNVAVFDTGIAVWHAKFRWDAVRPFSAIRYLYHDRQLTAWGGPGRGTVADITGEEWRSYLPTANHPEYPSASASFCAAHAQTMRRLYGTDTLAWSVPMSAGASVVEPGLVPTADLILDFDTWTEFEETCGLSRVWGGVHFMDAVAEGRKVGHEIGDLAYEFVARHIAGRIQ